MISTKEQSVNSKQKDKKVIKCVVWDLDFTVCFLKRYVNTSIDKYFASTAGTKIANDADKFMLLIVIVVSILV